jgi:hypothetical protein
MTLLHASKNSVFLTLAALLLLPIAGMAKDGRDFAGFYSFTEVRQQNTEQNIDQNTEQRNDQNSPVTLTLTVQVFNNSDADIKQASLVLHQSDPGMAVEGAFPAVKVFRNQTDVRLSQEFTIPSREYRRWQNGMVPRLMVHFMGANGVEQRRSIQLSRRPVLPTR